MSVQKSIRRKTQWGQYLNKWGLSGYTIGFYQGSSDILIWKSYQYIDCSLEKFTIKISSLDTLMKRVKQCNNGRCHRFILYLGGDNRLEFNTFDEVKAYLLIEKLGIANYANS